MQNVDLHIPVKIISTTKQKVKEIHAAYFNVDKEGIATLLQEFTGEVEDEVGSTEYNKIYKEQYIYYEATFLFSKLIGFELVYNNCCNNWSLNFQVLGMDLFYVLFKGKPAAQNFRDQILTHRKLMCTT